MSSTPDITPFVDLRIHDRDMQDIFDTAVLDLSTKMPTWVPREDNTEVLLLETLATEVAEAVFAINRLPGAVMTALMKLYGVPRSEGAAATGTLRVTAVDTFGYSIPIGTRFSVTVGTDTTYVVEAYLGGAINDGSLSTNVPVRVTENTSSANNIGPGASVYTLDSLPFVEGVVVAETFVGGADPENDADWLARSARRLRRLSEALIFPRHFQDAALELPSVEAASVADNMQGATAKAGSVTVAVWRSSGNFTSTELTTIANALDANAYAALSVSAVQMSAVSVPVSATVTLEHGYTASDITAAVPDIFSAAYGPGIWLSENITTFYKPDVARVLNTVPGIKSVRSVSSDSVAISRYSFPRVNLTLSVV